VDVRKQFSRIGWAYVIFLIATMAAQMIIGLLIYRIRFFHDYGVQMLTSQFAMYGCGFPVFYLLLRRIPSWKMTEPKAVSAGEFFLCVIFCFGCSYIGSIIGQFMMAFVNAMSDSMIMNPVDEMVMDMSPWIMALSTVVIAPVMEEIMFRKLLIDRIIPFGQKAAVIISGVSFGLFHGNFYQFFYACILGMIFAYVYSSTGNIRYTIVLHMIINFVGGMIPSLLMKVELPFAAAAGGTWMVLWMGGCILTALALLVVYVRHLPFFPAWERDGSIVSRIMTAPGAIAFLILCVIMFIWN